MKIALLLLCGACIAVAFDQADFFNTDAGLVKTTPIYHATLMIEGRGKVVYVDPSGKANYKGLPKADLILLTSDDPEHVDPDGMARITRKNSTAVIAPNSAASRFPKATAMANGETVSLGDISIQAVPAYKLPSHERGKANGYVLTFPGLRVYISGDTGFIPEMKALKNLDVAFVSVGTADTMSIDEAIEALKAIQAKVVYPYRYPESAASDIRKQLAAAGTEIRMRRWVD